MKEIKKETRSTLFGKEISPALGLVIEGVVRTIIFVLYPLFFVVDFTLKLSGRNGFFHETIEEKLGHDGVLRRNIDRHIDITKNSFRRKS